MVTDTKAPILNFFRTTPRKMLEHPPLASSLQNFETCLFLIGLQFFPSALVSCANAWEGVIKAKLGITAKNRIRLEVLLKDIRARFVVLNGYDSQKIDEFRVKRNHIVHFGFTREDEGVCARLLLKTGLPFLKSCYQELFDFYLDWQDIRSENVNFHDLRPEEMEKVGLVPDVARQIRIVGDVYHRAEQLPELDHAYCFGALSHFIRLGLKESARTEAEWSIIENADTRGVKFEEEYKLKADIERALSGPTWEFDCPICQGYNSVVAELDNERLGAGDVATKRCSCVECGFVVGNKAPYLSEVLLMKELVAKKSEILKEFGFL